MIVLVHRYDDIDTRYQAAEIQMALFLVMVALEITVEQWKKYNIIYINYLHVVTLRDL